MSSPTTTNILIFGPTGAVGRAAAIEAHRRGAHIWLAMRDTSKAIPGLDDSDPRYTRLYADLSEPSTVRSAVEESGATSAFVYTLFSSPDAMASSFAALKAGGITYVVLLSSFLVQGLASDEKNMQSFLPRVHSSTESALYVSAIPYAALRPWYFNSNVLWYTAGIKNSAVDLLYPELKHDYLAPSDIGIVAGAILAVPEFQTPDEGREEKTVYLCGPKLLTQYQAFEIIARVLGRDVKVHSVDAAKWRAALSFMPNAVLDTMEEGMQASHERTELCPTDIYENAVENIRRYKGVEPMGFEEWVKVNRNLFL